jgi:hypothetical protein
VSIAAIRARLYLKRVGALQRLYYRGWRLFGPRPGGRAERAQP